MRVYGTNVLILVNSTVTALPLYGNLFMLNIYVHIFLRVAVATYLSK